MLASVFLFKLSKPNAGIVLRTQQLCRERSNSLRLMHRSFRTDIAQLIHTVDSDTAEWRMSQELEKGIKERIFNTVLSEKDPEISFVRRKRIEKYNKVAKARSIKTKGTEVPTPLSLKYLNCDSNAKTSSDEISEVDIEAPLHYPYAEVDPRLKSENRSKINRPLQYHDSRKRAQHALEEKRKRMNQWMSDYEVYDETTTTCNDSLSAVSYGTSDPSEPVSKVSCGGCGALMHCQDHSIPGYLPKELYGKGSVRELQSMKCQRCHFLSEFNVALDVQVTPDEYPKIISCIQDKRAIAVLMIDLLDFPCSIWPDIVNIIGSKRPVVIVGNKVDLIPGDHQGYLKHLEQTLLKYVGKMGLSETNIKHVSLISAQSGFGVEDLITKLHDLWDYKSDVFLIGCTNVGKSTLFNRLLQSDFCKTQAVDLVQRATTSLWPGTTLNLLKFPILRPEGWRLALRRKRLLSERKMRHSEKLLKDQQFQRRRMYHMPSLLQYVGRTFEVTDHEGKSDMFSIQSHKLKESGISEEDYEFAHGRWCYDTPGVMHPDQILNILTTEELTKVIPKTPIIPRFFTLKPGRSLFLAGLGRIDLIKSSSDKSASLAVFSSSVLPVSIVQTEDADYMYAKLLGSELFAVPQGGPKRLADWPGLHAKQETLNIKGIGWKESCADIVLSSAGWISVCGGENMEMSFKVWTPFARGIHLREPALVPFAITYRGKRIDHTPTYTVGRADGKVPMVKRGD